MSKCVPFLALMCLCNEVLAQEAAKPATEKITYEQHIQPIFREKCGTCHNSNDKNGDLALDSYQGAMQGGASGEVIKLDGDVDGSTLYRVVAHLSEPFMPPEQPKLPDAQLDLIKKWIEQGALQNAGSTARPKKANVARVEVTTDRPPGPPPLPEGLSIDPVQVSARANGVMALATNPWSPLAAVSGHQQILLYNTSTLELVGVIPFPEGQTHILKFSRNGSLLMAGGGRGSHSGKVVLFDVRTGRREAEVGDEYDVVLGADVSPDQTLVALGGPKKIVRCYNVSTGELLYEMKKHTDWVTTLEFSPDGVLLATGDRSNGVFVWEASTGREFYALNGHTGAITDISWAPDSNSVATASEDGTVRIWEMQNGNQIKNWGAHGGGTLAVDFSRDARIITAGRDLRGKSWDAAGAAQKTFEPALPGLGTAAALCVETDRVLVGDLTGIVHVYNAKDGAKIGELTTNPASLATRITTTQELLQGKESAAAQLAATVAALEKGIADRRKAAELATQQLTVAQTALEQSTKTQAAADADLKAKVQAETTAVAATKTAETAKNQAATETEAANKLVTEAKAAVAAATEKKTVADAKVVKATEESAAKPDDEALKQALDAAQKEAAAALAAVETATNQQNEAVKQLAAKNDAQIAATKTYNDAKTASDQATAGKVAAEKLLTQANTALQQATALVATRKTESEKATAAAIVTPEQQKQLSDAMTAAKGAADEVAAIKQKLDHLRAAVPRSAETAAK